jgi:4'-phosphopantetheinyl transferase EntD
VVDIAALDRALRGLSPPAVESGVRAIDASDIARLGAGERALVAGAVDKRQREFATGRRLLRELIGIDAPIMVGAGGRPMLPAGTVGSLAHDRDVAVAVVSRSARIVAMGVDIEPDHELPPDVTRLILRPDEVGIDPHMAFTLKEAAYKAWSAMGGTMLDHHDVRLHVSAGRFVAQVVGAAVDLDGSWTTVAGRHLAVVVAGEATAARIRAVDRQ